MSKTVLNLNFQNTAIKSLPVDPIKQNYVRTVPNACLSIVYPTPVQNPRLVHYSADALKLLDLDLNEVIKPHFTNFFSGNQLLPGSEPYASAYCGHQFKIFVNLGDGRLVTLGDIVNNKGEKWEIQLKGAGKTPFSRRADGRAVLRSSIREFLCSEAMYNLGIPTTRAATLVTSDTDVERDIEYNGNIIQEKASIVARLAPTFIRFGSFQIADPMGPSAGNTKIIHDLLDYVTYNHYPNLLPGLSTDIHMRVIAFAEELCLRTAKTVALWQAYGFTHGVLNTDNMSIMGLTMDFGPFGFMESYDPDFVPNTSDTEGRYRFNNQPAICKWNLRQLFMSLGLAIDGIKGRLDQIVEKFCIHYDNFYLNQMRNKLGLLKVLPEDEQIVKLLLDTMHKSGSDFTNVFRCLSRFEMKTNIEKQPILDYIFTQSKEFEEHPLMTKTLWVNWLQLYKGRLDKESNQDNQDKSRITLMNNNNPKYILRNHLAQTAIEKAEKGDYSEVKKLFELLRDPYAKQQINTNTTDYTRVAPKTSNISLSCSS